MENNNGFSRAKAAKVTGILAIILLIAGFAIINTKSVEPADVIAAISSLISILLVLMLLSNHRIMSNPMSSFMFGTASLGTLPLLLIMVLKRIKTDAQFFSEISNAAGAAMILSAGVFLFFVSFFCVDFKNRDGKPKLLDYGWLVALPLIISGYFAFRLYNQKAAVSSEGVADFTMKPAALIAEFEKDVKAANAKYIGKTIRFSGSIVEKIEDTAVMLKLNGWKEGYAVNCSFDKSLKDELTPIINADSVELQCSCGGLLKPEEGMELLSESSLQMSRCTIIKHHKSKPELGTDVEKPNKEKSTNEKP
jgi:hypothetical protein